jgi:sulfatase maturation enzyme AslB (radical SAM superfamily)
MADSTPRLELSKIQGLSLPVYHSWLEGRSIFYAPGMLVGVEQAMLKTFVQRLSGLASQSGEFNAQPEDHQLDPLAKEIIQAAQLARQTWQALQASPFNPLCLTLYPNTECNLACRYCFAQPISGDESLHLSLPAVSAGARLVAANCRAAQQPLTVVFHGGGEPSLDLSWIESALCIVEDAADRAGLPIFRYIATNGVMPEENAAWLAQHFDLLGLSCDGPPDLQRLQRPQRDGHDTSAAVERTARVVRQAGKPLHVRATITPQAIRRQAEIAAYLCEILAPQEIHAEPVYASLQLSPADRFQPDQASAFIASFLEARQTALRYGVAWKMSGSRPGEIHGPYCQVLRSVLQLIPGDSAAACFKACTASQAQVAGAWIGAFHPASNSIVLDETIVKRIQGAVLGLRGKKDGCPGEACFNFYHCARDCPDFCELAPEVHPAGFRCQVNKLLAASMLTETAFANLGRQPAWSVAIKL